MFNTRKPKITSAFLPPTTPPGPMDPGPQPGSGSPVPITPPAKREPTPTPPPVPPLPGTPGGPGPITPVPPGIPLPSEPQPVPPIITIPPGTVPNPNELPWGAGIGQGFLGNNLELPTYLRSWPPPQSGPLPPPPPNLTTPPAAAYQAAGPTPALPTPSREGPGVELPTPTPGLDLNNTERVAAVSPVLDNQPPAVATKRMGTLRDVLNQYRRGGSMRMTFGG